MSIFGLAFRGIRGNGVRSLIIFLCVLAVVAFFVSTSLIIRGAQNSLNTGLERLGADIIVVPDGAQNKVETALLMGKPTQVWMSTDYLQKVSAIPGVASVSPQVYLQSLYGASCCAVSEMFIVVYDPATDFTVTPWLQRNLRRPLAKGEVIGGSYIFVPDGEKFVRLYGYDLTLKGNLEATGTGLDQTMFMTMETAQDMAKSSLTTAISPLEIPQGEISSIMVKVAPDAQIRKVAQTILLKLTGVAPIESPNLFGQFRKQMLGLLWGFLAISSLAWVVSTVLIGMVFSMAANERRQEMAVLRAIGATRRFVFLSLSTEAILLAVVAGILGITLSALGIYTFKDAIAESLGMPFLFPSLSSFAALFSLGLALAIGVVFIATFIPAYRISQLEPAVAMRE